MFLRRAIVSSAIILAGVLAVVISKVSGGGTGRIMQVLLYIFAGVLVTGSIARKFCKK